MITTYTIEEAISKEFGLKDVPTFTDFKPFREAREWLNREKVAFNYEKNVAKKGIVVFAYGASHPQITVIEKESDIASLKGATIFATLAKVTKSKSEERREVVQNEDNEPTTKPTPRKK